MKNNFSRLTKCSKILGYDYFAFIGILNHEIRVRVFVLLNLLQKCCKISLGNINIKNDY